MAELRWGAATDSGLVRDANEDAYVAEPMVFGVADGMGGHRAGEVASELASTTLRGRLGGGAANVDAVVAAVLEANAAIFEAAHVNASQEGMGTTVTALAVLATSGDAPEQLALVNVGDSRTYLHRNGELTRATVDHSYVQELVATGHITEAEARTHPRRNIVTRALGIEPTVRVDSWVLPLVRGDRFILCSDGLVDEVPDHEIADVAGGIADPQRAADELVAMANRHGGRDNVTVVVVDVVDGLDPEPAVDDSADAAAGVATTVLASTGGADAATTWADDATLVAETGVAGTGVVETGAAEKGIEATLPGAEEPAVDATTPGGGGTTPPGARRDDTAEMPAIVVDPGGEGRPRRRFTLGLFLVLLAIAAVLTLVITLIAVAASDDDEDPPPASTTPTTVSVTTLPGTTPRTTDTGSNTTREPTTTRPRPTTTLATPEPPLTAETVSP